MANLPTTSIPGVEIFSTGVFNGDEFFEDDLQAMVQALPQTGFQPTVKAGHAEGQEQEEQARKVFGSPALGYVNRLYVRGEKLVADLIDVPRKFADLIKVGAFKKVSAEIYLRFKNENTGSVLPRVLKSVAFLGADIPALTNLDSVTSLYSQQQHNGATVKLVTFSVEQKEEKKMEYRNVSDEVDAKARQYMLDHENASYGSAMSTVLESDPSLKRRYAFGEGPTGADAGAIVYDRAVNFAQQHGVTLAEAIRRVLDNDMELTRAYCFNHPLSKKYLNELT